MPDADTDAEEPDDSITTEETSVVVVGAGPGGCVLSYLLARSGVEVVLLERHADLDREFRGYFFQPLAVKLFAEMGVLDDVLALDHDEVQRPEITVFERSYEFVDLSRLPKPYDYGLLMEQPALLRLLIDRADEFENFEFRHSTGVTDLVREGGQVVGVTATDREHDEDLEFRSRLVVGADGRFSTVRKAAGLDPGLFDSSIELLWFKLPADAVDTAAQGRIDRNGILLYFGLGSEDAQAGWFIEKGTYPDIRKRGIDAFRRKIATVDPTIARYLEGFDQCSLLHIEPGLTEKWVDDGLLLLGDAAHVASPVGGQGNGLAIQDAAVAHSTLVHALEADDAPIPAERLRRFESIRRPAIEEVISLQRRGERAISWYVRHADSVPPWLEKPLARAAFSVAPQTPLVRKAWKTFALGPKPVAVDTTLFQS
ncbi:FAD-dependent monooxygenase [Haladaptatus sp. AB618]|uniref:FAD-dependent monooxygenase n=1 Tax=Haladaptatus sp. AB618 TaxID=2934173 RepID=UPI00209C65A3|nr:FAD-dependent monooxygenase [Haladaptatus sp. AB618]MCO8256273.1 FAD-dependent monooxygenase [Haladaptatus sp. AB618]